MRLTSRIVPVSRLDPDRKTAMLALMQAHYEGVEPRDFGRDLMAKDEAIVLSAPDGTLAGFSTQVVRRLDTGPARILFSGDTVIDRPHWGTNALALAWCRRMIDLAARAGPPLWWLLVSKHPRTYRYLSVFHREFWPRHDQSTPDDVQRLMDAAGASFFGPRYDRTTGLVRALPGGQRLRPEYAQDSGEASRDPHTRYFAARNPKAADGHELLCLAPARADNLHRYLRREMQRTPHP